MSSLETPLDLGVPMERQEDIIITDLLSNCSFLK